MATAVQTKLLAPLQVTLPPQSATLHYHLRGWSQAFGDDMPGVLLLVCILDKCCQL